MQKLYSTAFISCNTLVVLWTVSVFKLWINSTENRTNTEHWNVTGNWYNKIAVNSAINDFIAPCFECIWLTRKYWKTPVFLRGTTTTLWTLSILLFHFQEKNSDHFFDLIEQEIATVNPIFQTVFKTFLKDKDKVVNAMELPYSNAKLEATNNLIKVIKRNAFGFRNFENFKNGFWLLWTVKRAGRALFSLSPKTKKR